MFLGWCFAKDFEVAYRAQATTCRLLAEGFMTEACMIMQQLNKDKNDYDADVSIHSLALQ